MASCMKMFPKLEDQITCIICAKYFSQSVTIDCGHSFCKECLLWSWKEGDTLYSCPECQQISQIREFPELNVSLENLSNIGRQLRTIRFRKIEGQGPELQEITKFFDKEDQTPLCGPSCQITENRVIEEAVLYYGEKLQKILNYMKKNIGNKNLFFQENESPLFI